MFPQSGKLNYLPPSDGSTSRLDALVETSIVGQLTTVVAERAHVPTELVSAQFQKLPGKGYVPVRAGLVGSIVEAVKHVQEHGSDIARVGEAHLRLRIVTFVLPLPSIATTPNGEGQHKQQDPVELGTHGTREPLQIQQQAKGVGADHLAKPVQQAVQRASGNIKVEAIDSIELVDGEPVTGQKHGEEEDDEVVRLQRLVKTLGLRQPGGVLHHDDLGAVLALDVLGVGERPGQDETQSLEDHERNVGTVIDTSRRVVQVLSQWHLWNG